MRHGLGEHLLGEACSSLCKSRCYRIDQPILQHPDAPNTAFGKPSPAFEKSVEVTGERNPFQQIPQGSGKFFAIFALVDMVALKMNIATPTSELSTGIAKPE